MKILIEDAQTLEYYTAAGRWTKNAKEAATFPNSASAKHAGAKAPISKFNVVGFFSNSPQLTNLDDGVGAGAK
jgi:hypothetical protein